MNVEKRSLSDDELLKRLKQVHDLDDEQAQAIVDKRGEGQ